LPWVLAVGAGERAAQPLTLRLGEAGKDGSEVGLVLRAWVPGLVEQLDLWCQVGDVVAAGLADAGEGPADARVASRYPVAVV